MYCVYLVCVVSKQMWLSESYMTSLCASFRRPIVLFIFVNFNPFKLRAVLIVRMNRPFKALVFTIEGLDWTMENVIHA